MGAELLIRPKARSSCRKWEERIRQAGRSLLRHRFIVHEAGVDVLAARGLVTMNRDYVPARLERANRFRGDIEIVVVPDPTLGLGGEDTVEVDLGVFVVVHGQAHFVEARLHEGELAPQPDVGASPFRPDDGARGSAGAE